jgi:hypothetical protein
VIFQNPPFRRSSSVRSAGLLLLSMMLAATSAYADQQDITVGGSALTMCTANTDFSYAARPNVAVNEVIGVLNATGNVEWALDKATGQCSIAGNGLSAVCGGLTITIPSGIVPKATKPTLTGTPTTEVAEGYLTIRVTDSADPNPCGTRKYRFRTVNNGSGWGDPHMTTVDGVAYDFQGAGEFIALKEDKFEVQTRQRPVPTANPATDPHSQLNLCVSVYSAVAARIGSNRVTLQPNLSGQPDPSGLQLRVNGNLVTTIPEGGYALRAGASSDPSALLEGRIMRAAGGAYEIVDVDGTQLVATPAYWTSQQTWYMNLDVYQTSAVKGVWGRLADRSWLPALPDGTALGPMPPMMNERYQQLYDRFGNAWRVTDTTSLFDYDAQSTNPNTASFTVADWPRFNSQSCLIQGQTPAQPTTPQVAAQACSAITNAAMNANCTFDVMVTGNLGFAQTYATVQGFRPHGAGWQPVLPGTGATAETGGGRGGPGGRGGWRNWPWWVWVLILIVLIVIVILIVKSKKTT